MRVAITGGTGFIGRHLAGDLANRGDQIVVIARGLYTRGTGIPSHNNIPFVQANVTDSAALVQAFASCDAVVHCAGTSQDKSQTFQQVHVQGA